MAATNVIKAIAAGADYGADVYIEGDADTNVGYDQIRVHNEQNSQAIYVRVNGVSGNVYRVPANSVSDYSFPSTNTGRAISLAAKVVSGAPIASVDIECSRTRSPSGGLVVQGTSGGLLASNNLSDLDDPATARTNLALGSAATQATGTFAQVANDLSDLNDAATARVNLGLGSAATQAASAFAQVANDLSDLNDAATARANLGLGSAATQATEAVGPTVGCLVSAYLNADQVVPTGNIDPVQFETEIVDAGGGWSITNHDFTAPADGYYEVTANLRWTGANSRCVPHVYVDTGAGFMKRASGAIHVSDNAAGSSVSYICALSAGHKLEVRAENLGGSNATLTGASGLVHENFIGIKRLL